MCCTGFAAWPGSYRGNPLVSRGRAVYYSRDGPVCVLENSVADASNVYELIELAKKHPLKWFVPDIVLEDAVHVLHGSEESFKTMLTLQLHEALALGTRFLGRKVNARYMTGFAQLEMKPRQFGHRLAKFFVNTMPEIKVMPETLREHMLGLKTPKERIGLIGDWATSEDLQFLSIDSSSKLFPAGYSPNEQDCASDVFNQLQRLPTTWILSHDRKPWKEVQVGNDEIVGSGRFKQDPDIVHQMVRRDARAPSVEFHWGKMRAGEKPEPLSLFFDRIDYRLYPFHPYLHLLEQKAMSGISIITEAEARFGWKERRAREYLKSLQELIAEDGKLICTQSFRGHAKVFEINKHAKIFTPLATPRELMQPCSKDRGIYKGASLLEAAQD
jgi:hypothetical protein